MKIYLKSILCCTIAFSIFSANGLSIQASAQYDSDQVFPEEEVQNLINEANKMDLEGDKKNMSRSSQGSYPTRKGIILVTDDAYKGVIKTGHSAIIYTSSTVVEANEPGVEIGPNNWNTSKNQTYAVTVKNTTATQDSAAANYCYSQLGKPYNWNFYRMDYRDKFYCSHLIRAAYLDLYDIDLNTGDFDVLIGKAIHPMELVKTSKTDLIYRKQ